jgi:hypothetical protein
MSTHLKDPDERLDYTEDWDDEYLAVGETISSVTYTVPSGITNYSTSNTTTTTTIWLSGGTHGQEYLVSTRITTSAGRIAERSIKIIVRNR